MSYHISWWEKSVLLRPFDFAVLGAGLIGKQIAIKVQKKYPEARIAIIDRSPLSYGASTRNAGFACFGSVSEILDDFKRSGEQDVIALAIKRYNGIQKLLADFGAEAIRYRNCGSYEVFSGAEERDLALNAVESINGLFEDARGLKQVFNVKNSRSFHLNFDEVSLFNPYEGMLNSGYLNETISTQMHKSGIIPLYGLNIESIQNTSPKGYQLVSDTGMEIQCTNLILANNAFASQFLPEEDILPARGQIILTEPLDSIPFDGIFHSDKGYIYFRNLENRILLGGGRNLYFDQEETFEMQGSDALKSYLTDYLYRNIIPGRTCKIEMHWSGIMAMGKEKIPIVKRINDNLIACVRMSGMGVALGPVLSDEVMELL